MSLDCSKRHIVCLQAALDETLNMKVIAVLLVVVAAASAGFVASPLVAPTTLVRTPAFDSAVIKSDRLGGNFAYSTVEGHAYAAVTPVVQNVVRPVGVSYNAVPYPAVASPYLAAPYAPYGSYAPYAGLPYVGLAK